MKNQLNKLFNELKINNADLVYGTEQKIWEIWSTHPTDQFLTTRLAEGSKLVRNKQLVNAVNIFTEVIEKDPTWAEAWNKRATVLYMLGDYQSSQNDIDKVQYGSDETKTHRKIKHILGKNPDGKVGTLLVRELFTVGEGGWSGFPPHKHETDMLPDESRHNEVYNFRFNPSNGFGAQFLTLDGEDFGPVYHVRDGSTFIFDKGYHPCVAAPGFEMYYFTILAGESQRPLHMNYQKEYAYQLETIPGMQDMLNKFK